MMFFLQSGWGLFIGRFHPLLVHLPIGILIIAFLLEWLSRFRQLAVLGAAVFPTLLFGALSAVAACVAGYLLSLSGGYDEAALNLHMWMGIAVAVLSLLLCVFRKYNLFRKSWLPVSAAMILALSVAGHYGGNLTHGEDYLTAAWPFGTKEAATTATFKNIEDAQVYEQLVQPILEQKCYGCHNEQKLKGGLRLDGMAHIRKGGENGPVLKDSIPEMSELYKRLVLPESDDKRMPPKGKPQLTPQDVEILYWWIQQGAPDSIAVKELQKTPRIALVFEGMKPTGDGVHPYMPKTEVSAVNDEQVAPLVKLGVKVMPVAADNGYVMVSAVNAPAFGNADAKLLEPLAKQLVWLNLGSTATGDSALKIIASLPSLTRLQLEYTGVTDEGMQMLSSAKQLKYLNLTGTKITDKGLQYLQKQAALRELFIYGTGVTAAGVQQLRTALPDLRVDTGGYRLPVLATDTMVFKKQPA
ncbi:c-type cytochrome domain-containing protein [Chitinophaga deserti]|uniref:c-type cytochrome domain-containing protein n=1 Tax=Chitinophaga deserti TaxID=2164099 RepID=UPI000D6CC990|nr:c-type cytochrome domain-containing protein [Chitinophaga deserti]